MDKPIEFSVVIPTYNRLDNLMLTLAALASQIDPPEFEVIIADDGSTDETRDHFDRNTNPHMYAINSGLLNLTYQWCGPNLGFRPHRTRNIGIAQAETSHVILLDSDVMLNPNALRAYADLVEEHPSVVIIGLYHFALPGKLYPGDVRDWEKVLELVPKRVSAGPPQAGLDCRVKGFTDDATIITEYDGLGFFGGNQCWPVDLWWELGGQDELMPNGMGEDAEMGQKMRVAKIPVIQYAPVYGVHYHHPRDVKDRQRQVQESIKYIDKKYGIGQYADTTDKNTDPRENDLAMWYTKDYNARLVKFKGYATVYAISKENGWYVGIPSPDWISRLGFTPSDVENIDEDEIVDMGLVYAGVIRE